jgi:Uma2 family endonuclease
MSGDAARTIDPEFPHLAPDVVEGYRNAPETMVAEIIDGELLAMPRPHRQHVHAASALGEELGPPFRRGRGGPGGWVILDEPELRFGALPDIVIPDLAGWRRERVPADFLAGTEPPFITLAPDWVCEVLSPSTERVDRGRKLDLYRREGVAHVWLVSPALQTLEVLRRHDLGWLLVATFAGDTAVRAEPFDAVELDLAGLWSL